MLQPSLAGPSGSALQFLKVSSAWPRDGSILESGFASTPSAFMSTRNSEISVSRPLDPVRAATMAKSAMAPSGTGFFTPLRLPPTALSLIACGEGLPLPSNSGSVPIAAPDAIGDRHTEKPHVGEPLPQFAIVRLLAVEHRAHRLGRAFFGQKLAGLVAQLLLFVGEIEIHGATLLWEDLRTRKAVIPG